VVTERVTRRQRRRADVPIRGKNVPADRDDDHLDVAYGDVPVGCQKPFRLLVASRLGRSVVLVDGAAEDTSSPDRRVDWYHDCGIMLGRMLSQALVRPVPVEVREVLVEDLPRMALVVNQDPVGALAANGVPMNRSM
jgi:hypothetical protein